MRWPPIIVESAEDPGKSLHRIEARPAEKRDERWLQAFLFAHPEVIPAEQFDETFEPLVPLGREVSTSSGPIDLLCASPAGRLTIIETKLWQNPEKHRVVVAQVIDYAKEVSRWSYDDLAGAVLKAGRAGQPDKVQSLEEIMARPVEEAGLTMPDFQESVIANMESGEFLLLVIGDRISPNLALLTESIHGAAGMDFRLGLVELQMYSLDADNNWPILVVPDVMGRTVEEVRAVVKVQYAQEKPQVDVEAHDEPGKTGSAQKLSLAAFLDQTPRDLRPVYERWVDTWQGSGVSVDVGSAFLMAKVSIEGRLMAFVHAQPRKAVSLVRKKDVEQWNAPPEAYQRYLAGIESVPLALDALAAGKRWLKTDAMTAEDIDVIFAASTAMAEAVRDQ